MNQTLEGAGREACSGATTNDDHRFLRLWFEMSPGLVAREREQTDSKPWVILAKGGQHARYYSDQYLLINWASDGQSVKAHIADYRGSRGWGYQWSAALNGYRNYFRPGLTWSRRSQRGLSLRAMSAGGLFGDKGPSVFVPHDSPEYLLCLLAITNSEIFRSLVAAQMAFGSYEVGVLERTPLPKLDTADEMALATLARRAWSLSRTLDSRHETSHSFQLPALLQANAETLVSRGAIWSQDVRRLEAELEAIQAEIDERCFALYAIGEEDRSASIAGYGVRDGGSELAEADANQDADDEGGIEGEAGAEMVALAAELVSWTVGVAFGRFDIRLATGNRPLPVEPEPFDPLPVCSPGMLAGDDGLSLVRPPAGYPLSFAHDGILVDDPGHPRDLTAAVRAVFETSFGSQADAVWQEAAALLDPRNHDLRRWLAAAFFEHHLRRYSKSRRKAPIVWQLGIASGRYSIWCYAHRMTRDSLLAIHNDIVGPKLATEERRLSSLVAQAGQTPSARERAEIATQQAFIDELRTLLDELRSVAPLWNPDLDDGIVLVMAPLWRLVPTHKAWQKELRTKWDELVTGKYDWAHVAMYLWPERVVPKCAIDRSLAIAHGLEDVFWAEGSDGKWAARKKPTQPTAELVTERTSAAVKAALASLLDASGRTPDVRKRKA